MGNELKLSLENFQSISHGELVFHTGTSVIIGQSNSGKTATFRALKACLNNPAGSQRFIKKGTEQASVTLKYNGNQIIWKRTPKESSYIINGGDFIKTGRSNAFKLVEDTGFVVDSNNIIMNIEEELQLPFPFGIPKTELFKLYEDVFCVSDSAIIFKAAKCKEDEAKDKIAFIESDITKNKNKLSELKDFKNSTDLTYLKEKRDYFKGKMERTQFLSKGLDTIHKAIKVQEFQVEETSFENKISDWKEKVVLNQELQKIKELHAISKSMKEVKEINPIGLNSYQTLKDLQKTRDSIQNMKRVEVPEETFINQLNDYNELDEIRRIVKITEQISNFSAPVEDFISKLHEYTELKNYSKFFSDLKIKGKLKKEELKKKEELIKELEEKLKEFKICPLCHQPINN